MSEAGFRKDPNADSGSLSRGGSGRAPVRHAPSCTHIDIDMYFGSPRIGILKRLWWVVRGVC